MKPIFFPLDTKGDEEQSTGSFKFKLQNQQKALRTTATVIDSTLANCQYQNRDASPEHGDDVDPYSSGFSHREPKRRKVGTAPSRPPCVPNHSLPHIDSPSDGSLSSPTTAPISGFKFSANPSALFDDIDLAQEDEPLKPLPGQDFPPPTPPEEYSLSNSSLSPSVDHSYDMEVDDRPQTPTNPSAPPTSNPSTTPAALRMGSINLTHETHIWDDYRELLKYELEGCSHLCEPMRFFQEVLAWDPSKWSSIINTLTQDQNFQAAYLYHSNQYFEAEETDRYEVWKDLRALVLKRVETEFASIVGRRMCDWEDTHDTMLYGSQAGRKPDYCGVSVGWQEGKVPYWDDAIFWEEFKRAPAPLRRKKEGDEEDEQVVEAKGTASVMGSSAVADSVNDDGSETGSSKKGGSGKGRLKGGQVGSKTRKSKSQASSQDKTPSETATSGKGKAPASDSLNVPSTSSSSRKRRHSTNPQVVENNNASQPSQSSKTSKMSQKSDKPPKVNFTLSMLQAAGYAVECLSSFCLRLWSVGTFIEDGMVQLMYYDRAGAIVSEKWIVFSQVEGEQTKFIENFLTLVLAFSFCPPSQHGYDQEWVRSTSLPRPKLGNRDKEPFITGWQRRIGRFCFNVNKQLPHPQGYGLVTQAPRIIQGTIKPVPSRNEELSYPSDSEQEGQDNPRPVNLPESVVLKFSWQLTSREKEFELIEHAESKGVHGLPEILARSQGKKLSELPRARLIDNFDLSQDRCICLMVMPEYKPFSKLDDADAARAFKEIMQTHRDLYHKGRILHRDISINNLFSDPNSSRRSNGKFGILLDLNRAIRVDKEYDHHPKTRTGTLPFMALDLTRRDPPPPPHIYEHDVESFFWVLVWSIAFDVDDRLNLKWKQAKRFKQGISWIFHGRDCDTLASARANFLDSRDYMHYLLEARLNSRKTLWFWTWTLWKAFREIRRKAADGDLEEMEDDLLMSGQDLKEEDTPAPLTYEEFEKAFAKKLSPTQSDVRSN